VGASQNGVFVTKTLYERDKFRKMYKNVKTGKKALLNEHVSWNLVSTESISKHVEEIAVSLSRGSWAGFSPARETLLTDSRAGRCCLEDESMAFGGLCRGIISFECLQKLTPV
jgi:hypothetical protein